MICTDLISLGISTLNSAVTENVHTFHGGHYLVLDPPTPGNIRGMLVITPTLCNFHEFPTLLDTPWKRYFHKK